jgi:hypothetical protein
MAEICPYLEADTRALKVLGRLRAAATERPEAAKH